jgi:hypothetical protein
MARARTKNQPRIVPTVKIMTAANICWLPSWLSGINKMCDIANIVIYIAKKEERMAKNLSDHPRSDKDSSYMDHLWKCSTCQC